MQDFLPYNEMQQRHSNVGAVASLVDPATPEGSVEVDPARPQRRERQAKAELTQSPQLVGETFGMFDSKPG